MNGICAAHAIAEHSGLLKAAGLEVVWVFFFPVAVLSISWRRGLRETQSSGTIVHIENTLAWTGEGTGGSKRHF